jgi:hypothetical protein
MKYPTSSSGFANGLFFSWFGALYGINPIGSKALGNAGQAALLQKMAWDTLTKEPLNGLKG